MNRSVGALVAFVLGLFLAFAGTGTAAVVERDWKTPGDGLLTYDDVNQREWLDLSQTRLDLFQGATREDKYQDVVSELVPGGLFDGFSVAGASDVISLAQSAGIDVTTDDFGTNQSPVQELIDLLGPTLTFPSNRVWSRGYLDELDQGSPTTVPRRRFSVVDLDINSPPLTSRASLRFATGSDFVDPATFGVMLYRQVPEPSTTPSLALASLLQPFCRAASRRQAS